VILRTNHRLRWPPTFPSGTILQSEELRSFSAVALGGEVRAGGNQGC
jgi:hypothetical protein